MTNNNDDATLTHNNYAAAMASLKKWRAAAGVARWAESDGRLMEGYWCPRRKRVVTTVIHEGGKARSL